MPKKQKEKYLKEVHKIEDRYLKLVEDLPLNYPKALNFPEEKKKFFEALKLGQIYNPQFHYEKDSYHKSRLRALDRFYRSIDLSHDYFNLKKIYKKKMAEIMNIINYHIYWGQAKSTKYVIRSKGKPSYWLFRQAKSFCKKYKNSNKKSKSITAREIGKALVLYVKELTGEDIELSYVKSLASRVNISSSKHLLEINPNAKFTSLDLERLKVHEIGVHFMRYFNAEKMVFDVFKTGTAGYLETEEGLAVYNEDKAGVLQKHQLFVYAGRVLASYYTLKKSFYQLYKTLRSYGFTEEEAFRMTFRAKRNISDTRELGGFTKDYVYFSGYHKIKKFAAKNDISDLYMGKIALKDLPKLKKYLKYIKEED